MATGPFDLRLRTRALVWSDALAYVLVVTALATLLALVVGIATGGGLVRAKTLLFLGGFGLMAYATFRLWPSSPSDLEDDDMSGVTVTTDSIPADPDRTRVQKLVRALPPMRWLQAPPPHERLTPEGKLFWSSVAILVVSYLMETVFGIV